MALVKFEYFQLVSRCHGSFLETQGNIHRTPPATHGNIPLPSHLRDHPEPVESKIPHAQCYLGGCVQELRHQLKHELVYTALHASSSAASSTLGALYIPLLAIQLAWEMPFARHHNENTWRVAAATGPDTERVDANIKVRLPVPQLYRDLHVPRSDPQATSAYDSRTGRVLGWAVSPSIQVLPHICNTHGFKSTVCHKYRRYYGVSTDSSMIRTDCKRW